MYCLRFLRDSLPGFFELDNKKLVVQLKGAKEKGGIAEIQVSVFICVKDAVDACPVTAITLKERSIEVDIIIKT